MREIVDEKTVNLVLAVLAIAGPVAGLIIGAVVGGTRKAICPYAVRGLAVGLAGVLVFALWRVYSAITGRLGLDSLANLLVNLALFVALGLVLGIIASRLWKPA